MTVTVTAAMTMAVAVAAVVLAMLTGRCNVIIISVANLNLKGQQSTH